MSRAFLSHSSKDKEFVNKIADELGRDNIVYDKYTFEAGEKTLDEIINGFDASDIFVLLLSSDAIESKWVREEILIAKTYFDEDKISKIYPLLIDKTIDYSDNRIPNWIRKEYNLKLIARPSKAKRLIEQRLKEISWKKHPILEKKENIFVGRNELIGKFEERIDNFNVPTPTAVVASGITNIGRKSFLKHCLRKSNIIHKDSYEPSLIDINTHESIEDFILKIYDLGFSETKDFGSFLEMSMDEKIDIAAGLVRDVQDINEILFIEDRGGIITPGGNVVEWFESILNHSHTLTNKLVIGMASNYRTRKHIIENHSNIFYLEIPELTRSERGGLFKRYLDVLGIELSKDDFKHFLDYLSGFPEQIYFAADLIKNEGLYYAKNNIELITEFASEKVSTLISKYEQDTEAHELLKLLAEFDFISYEFLFQLLDEDTRYKRIVSEFISLAICELLGRNKEYLRLNDTVKDYILRGKSSILPKYRKKLNQHLEDFVNNEDLWVEDISNFFYSMKEALSNGYKPKDKYLIPSHFLKTMVDKYQKENKYSEVVELADRVLENTYNLDEQIKREIYYWLCLSLARLRDDRFLKEVQYFQGKEYDFLVGYYYRMIGKHSYAIDRNLSVLDEDPNFQRAKRELVNSYIAIDDYEAALSWARANYEQDNTNPFHIQAYLNCLMHLPSIDQESLRIIRRLLDELSDIGTEKSSEMAACARCKYHLKIKNDPQKALDIINDAIIQFPHSPYPLLKKFEVMEILGNGKEMEDIIAELERKYSFGEDRISHLKARLLAKTGKINDALLEIDRLKYYPETTKDRLKKRLIN